MTERQMERWIAKVDTRGPLSPLGHCWTWIGAKNSKGYGNFFISKTPRRKQVLAHRIAFEHYRGPIPVGLQIDHLCRNRACVNPWHLEPVTNQENALRGERGLQTECKHGHPYDEQNTLRTKNGQRLCRACARARRRKAAA